MKFSLTVLGSNSAIPTATRHPTSQLLNVGEKYFLIDCGEGTQILLRKYRLKMQRIGHIFISHLHGDHYFGLIGLLTTMHLLGRTKELHLYAPFQLKKIIDLQLDCADTILRYPLTFHELEFKHGKTIFENETISIQSMLMKHRIPCCGFLFKEKEHPRKIRKEVIKKHKIPLDKIPPIKRGENFITENGELIENKKLTFPPPRPRAYAYSADTAYNESMLPLIKEVDLLYHEATFSDDMVDRAELTFHSTAKQAGAIAQKAAVKKLIIGHYSARYKDLNPLLLEAKSIFENTELAIEGKEYIVPEETEDH